MIYLGKFLGDFCIFRLGDTYMGEGVEGVFPGDFGFGFLVVVLTPISTVFIRVNFPLILVNSIQVLFFFLVDFVGFSGAIFLLDMA